MMTQLSNTWDDGATTFVFWLAKIFEKYIAFVFKVKIVLHIFFLPEKLFYMVDDSWAVS